jgi:predicted regulator of Ras-like GTPase activity (Roadblock/LC7/MglB family)
VARGGLSRYPGLADAHDLLAKILSDQGDLAGAFDAWADALRLDPMRTGALKGIAFLYFRAGDAAAAIEHLQRAAEVDPDDISIAQALARVRHESRAAPGAPAPEPAPEEPPAPDPMSALAALPTEEATLPVIPPVTKSPPVPATSPPTPDEAGSPFTAIDGGRSVVLVDANGLLLAGSLTTPAGAESGDRVAAELAGVSREASRAGRLLGLGQWHSITLECPDAHFVLVQPTAETVLLAAREPSLPMARVALVAERAAREAKSWLERVQ